MQMQGFDSHLSPTELHEIKYGSTIRQLGRSITSHLGLADCIDLRFQLTSKLNFDLEAYYKSRAQCHAASSACSHANSAGIGSSVLPGIGPWNFSASKLDE